MSDCQGIEIVAKDAHLVAYIFACLLMSRCRYVGPIPFNPQACAFKNTRKSGESKGCK